MAKRGTIAKATERSWEQKWELLMSRLRLHDGCWAVRTDDELYVFPAEITREKAIEILRKAHEYNQTKLN